MCNCGHGNDKHKHDEKKHHGKKDDKKHDKDHGEKNHSGSQSHLKAQMRLLWSSHFWLTREVVTNAAGSSPCLGANLALLYENQVELGANFGALVHNAKAGKQLAAELKIHIDIAVQIVTAAIKGQSIDKLYKQWQKNASEIAAIYAKYGNGIRYEKINEMMQEHLATTLAEAVEIIKGNCQASAEAGEVALAHINHMSDYLARHL